MEGPDPRARLAQLGAAFALLTRLPVARLIARLPQAQPARAVWAYPLAGAAVGLIGGGMYALALALSLPAALAAIWGLAATVLTTGALHEDGLADFADGLAGSDRERRLEIMRDSRMGAYGAIALLLSLGLRVTAMALLARPELVMAGLVAAGAASRAGAGALMAALPPARTDGLAAAMGRPDWVTVAAGFAISILIGIIVLEFMVAMAVALSAALAALAIGAWARTRLGGQTGDVLGACIQASECLALTALVAIAA